MYLRFHDARCHISLHQVQGNWSYHKRKTLLGNSRLFSQKMKIKTISLPGLRGGCNKVKNHYLSVTSWHRLNLSSTKKWLCLLDIYLYPPVLSGPKVGLRILDLRRTLLVWNARLSTLCNDTGASKFVNHSRHVHTRLYLLGHFYINLMILAGATVQL